MALRGKMDSALEKLIPKSLRQPFESLKSLIPGIGSDDKKSMQTDDKTDPKAGEKPADTKVEQPEAPAQEVKRPEGFLWSAVAGIGTVISVFLFAGIFSGKSSKNDEKSADADGATLPLLTPVKETVKAETTPEMVSYLPNISGISGGKHIDGFDIGTGAPSAERNVDATPKTRDLH